MTSPSPAPAAPASAPPPASQQVVNPTPDTRLDQLAAEYALVKPRMEALKEQLEGITDGIKAELARAHPTSSDVLLTSPHLTAPLRFHRVTGWRMDSKTCKAQDPETYVKWAVPTVTWRLDQVK